MSQRIDYMPFPTITTATGANFLPVVGVPGSNTIKSLQREFGAPVEGSPATDPVEHQWSNYFKSGLQRSGGFGTAVERREAEILV